MYDVVIIGAGSSGALAAIASGRLGLKTCLIEKGSRIGGVPINTLMGSFANLYFDDSGRVNASKIVGELIERIIKKGGTVFNSMEELMNVNDFYQITIPYQPEVYESVLTDMLIESKVDILLNIEVNNIIYDSKNIKSLEILSNQEVKLIDSKVFIDATGNATIASASGADVYEKNSSYGCLMRVGGVDISKTIEHIEKTKQWNYIEEYNQWLEEVLANRKYRATGAVLKDPVSYDHAPMLSKDDHFMNDEKWNYIKERWEKFRFIYTLEVSLFRNELKKAVESGDFNFEIYHDDKSGVTMNGDGISYGSWGQNVALINVAKAFGFNPKYMEDESHANILSRKYNLTFLSFLKKYVPGFENSFILDQGTRATNRSCRHIDNSSMMDEILDFPMYTFKTMYSYQTPKEITYKSIVGGKLNNLFVIGKGAYQSESFRSQISCMLMGISSAAAAKTIIEDKSNTLNINRDLFKSNLDILFTWEFSNWITD